MENSIIDQARQLILEKQYDEARKKLKQISNNPRAKKWLTKLDEIAPESPLASDFSQDISSDFTQDLSETQDKKLHDSKPSVRELASKVVGDYDTFDDDVQMIIKADNVTLNTPDNIYRSLNLIMNLYKIFGVLMLAGTILGTTLILVQVISPSRYYQPNLAAVIGSAFVFLAGGVITSASIYAVGELIHLIISIEKNVRISAQFQASNFKQLLELNHHIKR